MSETRLEVPISQGRIQIVVNPESGEVFVEGARAVEVAVPFRTREGMTQPDDAFIVRTAGHDRDGDMMVRILRRNGPWWPNLCEPRLTVLSIRQCIPGNIRRPAQEEGVHVVASSGLTASDRNLGVQPFSWEVAPELLSPL